VIYLHKKDVEKFRSAVRSLKRSVAEDIAYFHQLDRLNRHLLRYLMSKSGDMELNHLSTQDLVRDDQVVSKGTATPRMPASQKSQTPGRTDVHADKSLGQDSAADSISKSSNHPAEGKKDVSKSVLDDALLADFVNEITGPDFESKWKLQSDEDFSAAVKRRNTHFDMVFRLIRPDFTFSKKKKQVWSSWSSNLVRVALFVFVPAVIIRLYAIVSCAHRRTE
jgi:hypothetical protein